MRQRKAKDIDKRMEKCSPYILENTCTDNWSESFANNADLYLEIGCGKGDFIIKKAKENLENNYLAFEGQVTVILRALEKAMDLSQEILPNLKFMNIFITDLGEIFNENQLSGIYLNFSDPWPKARHAKRRLTHRNKLESYYKVIKPGGFIEIKTDNDELYAFTLEQINDLGYRILESSTDLHASGYVAKEITTEYEERFKSRGKSINYVKIAVE